MVERTDRSSAGRTADKRAARTPALSPHSALIKDILFTENKLNSILDGDPIDRREEVGILQERIAEYRYGQNENTALAVDLIRIAGGSYYEGPDDLTRKRRVRQGAQVLLQGRVVDLREEVWVHAQPLRDAYTQIVGAIDENTTRPDILDDLITLGHILKPDLFSDEETRLQLETAWNGASVQLGETREFYEEEIQELVRDEPQASVAVSQVAPSQAEEVIVDEQQAEDTKETRLQVDGRIRMTTPEPLGEAEGVLEQREAGERIDDHELGDYLAAFGNHESIAVLLTLLEKDKVYDGKGLRDLRYSSGINHLIERNKSLTQWLDWSLVKFGLVEQVSEGAYRITERGEKGKPLARALLSYTLTHDASLKDLFGSTKRSTAGVRSPLTRLRIFRELAAKGGTCGKLDIVTALLKYKGDYQPATIETFVREHLDKLEIDHIISYKTVPRNEPRARYKLLPTRPEKQPGRVMKRGESFKQLIYRLMQDSADIGQVFTSASLYDILLAMDAATYGEESRPKADVQTYISAVLSELKQEEYVEEEEVFVVSAVDASGISAFSNRIDAFAGNPNTFQEEQLQPDALVNLFRKGLISNSRTRSE